MKFTSVKNQVQDVLLYKSYIIWLLTQQNKADNASTKVHGKRTRREKYPFFHKKEKIRFFYPVTATGRGLKEA